MREPRKTRKVLKGIDRWTRAAHRRMQRWNRWMDRLIDTGSVLPR